jgi:integrase
LANSGAQDREALRGAISVETAKIEDYLKDFAYKQTTMGLDQRTVEGRVRGLLLLHKRGADLFNPESVFRAIDHAKRFNHATGQLLDEDWSDGSKNNAAQAYAAFCTIGRIQVPNHLNFNKWSHQPQKLPWIPLEREIDELIAGCNRRFGAFLQLLKETGVRSGEAWRLKWQDMDVERCAITFNLPEKGSNPRQHRVSAKLIAMLNSLPKNSDRIFGDKGLDQFRKCFMLQRKRIAKKLQNPRINRISFHTLRHFYGTMEYHKTKDILHVQERLGHRSITSTMVYTHLVNFEGDDYHTATARTLKEDEDLLNAGFEYVTERDGVKIYRKRK